MIQLKTFKLKDSEAASKWLEKNFKLVVVGEKGPEVKIHNGKEAYLTILYDKNGYGSPETTREGYEISLINLKDQLEQYKLQLLEHIEQQKIFPKTALGKGSNGKIMQLPTVGYQTHTEGIRNTKAQIRLQLAKMKAVETLLANPDVIDFENHEDENADEVTEESNGEENKESKA